MHSVSCPACGTRVELDFQIVAGVVWCPIRKKTFPPAAPAESQKTEQIDRPDDRGGEDD